MLYKSIGFLLEISATSLSHVGNPPLQFPTHMRSDGRITAKLFEVFHSAGTLEQHLVVFAVVALLLFFLEHHIDLARPTL